MSTPNNILILNHHHIGDVVNSTSLVAGVRRRFPSAYISMFVRNPPVAELFEPGLIDRYCFYPKSRWQVWRTFLELSRPRPDLLMCTTEISHTWFVSVLCMLSRARHVVCEDTAPWFFNSKTRVPLDMTIHKFESNAQIADALDVTLPYDRPYVHLGAEAVEFGRQRIAELGDEDRVRIAIAPGFAAYGHKAWPKEKFVQLIDRLLDTGRITPILMGSKQDIRVCEYVQQHLTSRLRDRCVSFVNQFSLTEFLGTLKATDMALSNDSGTAHLAGALDVPVVVLFGPTNPNRCAPYPPQTVVWLKPECAPCYPRMLHGCGNPVCIQDLPVETVFAIVQEVASRVAESGRRCVLAQESQ